MVDQKSGGGQRPPSFRYSPRASPAMPLPAAEPLAQQNPKGFVAAKSISLVGMIATAGTALGKQCIPIALVTALQPLPLGS